MNPLIPYAGAIIILTVWQLLTPRHKRTNQLINAAAAHNMTIGPTINYTSNPYRVGAYVYVRENDSPSELDWTGTYLGMHNGYALIRDHDTHELIPVMKDHLYAAQR